MDNTLSLDAGDVAIANMTLRPEIRIDPVKDLNTQKHTQITYAQRLACESVRTDVVNNTCGSGAELGFVNSSADGMTSITDRIMLDKVGTSTSSDPTGTYSPKTKEAALGPSFFATTCGPLLGPLSDFANGVWY